MMNLDLFEYSNYKDFLADFFSKRKEQSSSWSFAVWARSLELSSPSTLSMIVNGKRHPGPDVTEKLCNYFDFNEYEKNYFLKNIEIQKNVSSPVLVLQLLENIKKESQEEKKEKNLRLTSLGLILRLALNTSLFPKNKEELKEKFLPLFPNQNFNKTFETVKDEIITTTTETPKGIKKDDIFKFHQSVLRTTEEAFNNSPKDERTFRTSFLCIEKEDIQKMLDDIENFQQYLTQKYDSKEGRDIVQMNLQMFKVTK